MTAKAYQAKQNGSLIIPGTITATQILDGTIMNGDINASADIFPSKLLHVGANNVLKSNGTANVAGPVLTADISPTIQAGSVLTGQVIQSDFIYGVVNGPAVAAASGEQYIPDLVSTITTVAGSSVWVMVTGAFYLDQQNNFNIMMNVDGGGSAAYVTATQMTIGLYVVVSTQFRWGGLPAGSHVFRARWAAAIGTLTAVSTMRYMFVQELRR